MRLSHNIPSLNIYNKYKSALVDQGKAVINISTGSKVNNAKDDPGALSRGEAFNMQLRGLQMASQNAQDSISLLQTSEGALDGMTSMLQRIRELSVQGQNGTNTSDDKNSIQMEISSLVDNIDNLAKSTNINGVNLLSSNTSDPLQVTIGANVGESLSIPTYNFTSSNLTNSNGVSLNDLKNINSLSNGFSDALSVVDAVSNTISSASSKYGALENTLNSTITNMNQLTIENQTANSNITDTDMASEMLRYSKDNVLVQAGIAMMAQTNRFPHDILNILQNVK